MQTIFLDRDGVINRNSAPGDYVKTWEEFQFLPGALAAIARLTKAGFRLLVITNQACISKGIVSWTTMYEIHARMMQEVNRAGGHLEAVLCCPHLEGAGCGCRKPAPGLILRAQAEYQVDLGRAILVGDSVRDMQTGAAVGVPTIMVLSGIGQVADLQGTSLSCRVANDLAHATQLILDRAILPPHEPLGIQGTLRR
jgi:D-glycero-D-manno-heptose 1,7-bisphosphate phosphatase